MAGRYIFDLETDNLLDDCTTIHSLVLEDIDTGDVLSCADQPGYVHIEDGLEELATAELIVGHNVIRFDVPAIKKLHPEWDTKATVRDTLLMSRMAWPDIGVTDQGRIKHGYPRHLVGKYSLEAAGHRMGEYKGDYKGPWDKWSDEMQVYCKQDVHVTRQLWNRLYAELREYERPGDPKKWYLRDAVTLEHEVAEIVFRQERHGFAFDVEKAQKLYSKLIQRRLEIEREVKAKFRPWFKKVEEKVAPRTVNNKRPDLGVTVTVPRYGKKGNLLKPYEGPIIQVTEEGSRYTKVETVEFNCNSRHHIADRLITVWGWKPKEFTNDGQPKIDDEILNALPYPEAQLLAEYLMLQKRIAMIAEGKAAWLKVEKNGRIHGTVITCGTPTARMTHNSPNVAQTPSNKSPYGKECRDLFTTTAGWVLIGCDADSLEGRDLAGYMAEYDGGAYVEALLAGDKSKGTDNHSVNARALGLDPKGEYPNTTERIGREIGKRWFYAFIYGAGDYKLGSILAAAFGVKGKGKITALGKETRAKFLEALPALGKITRWVRGSAKQYGKLRGLDGRWLHVRSEHAALNVLLQSAGAIQMKRALVILDTKLQALGLVPGTDYEFVANVHDEWQIEARPECADTVAREAAESIKAAGEYYEFGCPLAGNADIGHTWAETH